MSHAEALQQQYEPRPNPQDLTSNPDPTHNSSSNVDYEPHPSQSLKLSPEREGIVQAITNLYSGSASEKDMQVYSHEAIYDDPWSYCDTRYKIAGQWYGILAPPPLPRPKTPSSLGLFAKPKQRRNAPIDNCPRTGIPKVTASSKTLSTEVVSSTPTELAFKLRQEYTPRLLYWSKPVNSLVTLMLDAEGKVKYHKDMWNQKDYSHQGLGKVMKTLNGDHLTKVTRPPRGL